jgi:hypothetical protein
LEKTEKIILFDKNLTYEKALFNIVDMCSILFKAHTGAMGDDPRCEFCFMVAAELSHLYEWESDGYDLCWDYYRDIC